MYKKVADKSARKTKTVSLSDANIMVVYTEHEPKRRITGVNYIQAKDELDNNYLSELVEGDSFLSMPLTCVNGALFPSISKKPKNTVGYAVVKKKDIKNILGCRNLSSNYKKNAENILFKTLARSY